jgi:hypothetical protein
MARLSYFFDELLRALRIVVWIALVRVIIVFLHHTIFTSNYEKSKKLPLSDFNKNAVFSSFESKMAEQ